MTRTNCRADFSVRSVLAPFSGARFTQPLGVRYASQSIPCLREHLTQKRRTTDGRKNERKRRLLTATVAPNDDTSGGERRPLISFWKRLNATGIGKERASERMHLPPHDMGSEHACLHTRGLCRTRRGTTFVCIYSDQLSYTKTERAVSHLPIMYLT